MLYNGRFVASIDQELITVETAMDIRFKLWIGVFSSLLLLWLGVNFLV